MKAIITRGISASGKSTWAQSHAVIGQHVQIERDLIRWELFTNGIPDWNAYKFTRQREKSATELQRQRIIEARDKGLVPIISDTHVNVRTYNGMVQWLKGNGFDEIETMDFDIDVMVALERDARRKNGVGYKVIMKQYKQYMEQLHSHNYHDNQKPDKPSAICVDIDGTIAQMNGRSPFEWHRVGEDSVVPEVKEIVENEAWQGTAIIFLSGRDAVCMPETKAWLLENVDLDGQFYLFMREQGDNRKDTIVKKEIFDKYVDQNFNVKYVIDDRPAVCRVHRYEKGLKVIQVGDPYQEF